MNPLKFIICSNCKWFMRIIQTNNIHTGNSTFINSRGSEREREKEREEEEEEED